MPDAIEVSIRETVGKGYEQFWRDKHRYRVVKGGRASKKSTTMALWLVYHIMKHPLANALVVRQLLNTHKDSTFAVLKWAMRRLKVYHLWSFKENPLECTYRPTGQKILFRGFDDPLKLTSITVPVGCLCWVWIEEAFEIDDESKFRTLDETIRGEMPEGLWKQITLTFNPWVASHWTKTRFFDNKDPQAFTLTTTYKCNEWLDDNDRKLIEYTEKNDPERYKVIGLGEYGIPGSAFFPEFRTDIHVIDPFPIPEHWKRYTTMDYGLDMLAVLWIAIDEEGNAFVYREVYEPGLIISEAAHRIRKANGGERIFIKYAPPDLWNRRQETGRSAADIFRENGELLCKSSNDREAGWLAVKEWLRVIEVLDEQTGGIRKTSRLKIFSTCRNLIRCLPQLRADAKEPSKADDERNSGRHELTHAPDALRGFCVMRQKPSDPPARDRYSYFRQRMLSSGEGELPESYINMRISGYRR
ncbi:MAG: PBSX family phage terminase large subunit [Oscillospiraceae bacterium]